uniref:NIF3-like protein 1 n=1 Tax=Takifugu rubripes TaxID=31033 RepID=H2TAT9_TAKRU
MLTECRKFSWKFVAPTFGRFCTGWSLNSGTCLFSSPSTISSIPPFLSHPGQSKSASAPCRSTVLCSCSRWLSHSTLRSDTMDLKEVLQSDWKQLLAVRAIESGMAIFSPHTSWDSVKGGLNDWLVGGLGSGQVSVLSPALSSIPSCHKLEFTVKSREELHTVMEELKACNSGTGLQHSSCRTDNSGIQVSVVCSDSALTPSVQAVLRHNATSSSLNIMKLEKPPLLGHGQGRLSVLNQPVTVATAIEKMKSHLGLTHLRLALGVGKTLDSSIFTVAVCAGSGASVLTGVKADLYITGEMSHHEVLDAVAKGTSVILSDHSNSERGFLSVFREKLTVRLPDSVAVVVSKVDRDPLEVV